MPDSPYMLRMSTWFPNHYDVQSTTLGTEQVVVAEMAGQMAKAEAVRAVVPAVAAKRVLAAAMMVALRAEALAAWAASRAAPMVAE